MPYKTIEPDEKVSSPASSRDTLKIKNDTSSSGKFSLKIGDSPTENDNISARSKKEFDVKEKSFILINKGRENLEWLRD